MYSDGSLSLKDCLSNAQQDGKLLGELKFDVALSRYTTWRIGGKAECFYQPASIEDLQNLLSLIDQQYAEKSAEKSAEKKAIYWLGLGSNLLIRDGGLKGIVICSNGVLNSFSSKCSDLTNECLVSAEAGLSSAVFSRKAANEAMNGAEFLSGIPGTIGGALAMNAGAFGREIWTFVKSVTMVNRQGDMILRMKDDFNIQYRHVELNKNTNSTLADEWFVQADFLFKKDSAGLQKSKQEIKQLLAKRAATQPTTQANAGSVFKNPKNDFAARLIESCGLKGLSINGAQISEKHANFIINKHQARSCDVEALIKKIQDTVFQQCEIKLETEVRIIGQHINKNAEFQAGIKA